MAFVVRAKLPAPTAELSAAGLPGAVVIVGGGAAGNAAAETLRREGYAGPITLLSADRVAARTTGPTSRRTIWREPRSRDWIPLRPPEFYAEHSIDLRLGARVAAIDPAARAVPSRTAPRLPTARSCSPPAPSPSGWTSPGARLPHVHVLAHARRLRRADRAAAATAQRAVVIGASFIGLEVAASLRTRGLEVHVVAPETRPMERVMGPELGDFVRSHPRSSTAWSFHLGATVAAIADEP